MNLKKKQLSLFILFALSMVSARSFAAEFHVVTGGFNVSAASTTSSGSIMNLGAYSGAYERRILRGLELSAGYTILVSGFVSGDLAYGLDLGINYYPISDTEPFTFTDGGHSVLTVDLWRPYIGVYFSQRQFQLVQAGYAGAGAAIGVERALGESYSLKLIVRHLFFAGSSQVSAQETTMLAGITFSF